MSNQYPPPPPPPPPANYPPPPAAKSSKPVYKRWWFWVGVVVVIAIVGSALGGGKKDDNDAAGSDSPTTASSAASSRSADGENASATPKPKVSQGLGANDASKDVTIGKLKIKTETYGGTTYSVKVAITNHSSKRSDYFVTVALESADGSEQLDTTTVIGQNVEPGQTTKDSGTFLKPLTDEIKVPKNARVTLQEVQRTEST